MSIEPISVLIADSQPIMREGLRSALQRANHIRVTAEATDGYSAVLAANRLKPDVVILDAALGNMDCYETVRRLKAQSPDIKILVVFVAYDPLQIQQLVQAGTNGFVSKSANPEELPVAVQAVISGGAYLSNAIASLVMAPSHRFSGGFNVFSLTARELEILRYLGAGFSNKETARRVGLSVRTVETHRYNIRSKTKASRLKDLMNVARQLALEPILRDGPTEIDSQNVNLSEREAS